MKLILRRPYKNLLLLILFSVLPYLYWQSAKTYMSSHTSYSSACVDPEMSYLHNGLNILHGHLPYFMDHPGFPIQYQMAATISLHQLLYAENSIDEEVLLNPDEIIRLHLNITLLITAFILLLSGYLIYVAAGRIVVGIITQLTFISAPWCLELSYRIIPESYSLILVLVITLLIFRYSKQEQQESINKIWKYPLLFAFACCLSISLKITFALTCLIPLIVLNSKKEKLLFSIYLLPCLFATFFPVINRWNYFRSWVGKLFFHSGQYGNGPDTIVDFDLYRENLINILRENTALLLLMSILLLVQIFSYFQLSEHKKRVYIKGGIALCVFSLLSILIIAKQLKMYYLALSMLSFVPSAALTLQALKRPYNFIIYIACICVFTASILESYDKINQLKPQSVHKIAVLETIPFGKVILNYPDYYGSPFVAYSAFFGLAFSSENYRNEILPSLKKLYPNFHTFHIWNNLFNEWDGRSESIREIMNKSEDAYVFIGGKNEEQLFLQTSLGCNFLTENKISIIAVDSISGAQLLRVQKLIRSNKEWTYQLNNTSNLSTDRNTSISDYLSPIFRNDMDTVTEPKDTITTINEGAEFGLNHRITDVITGEKYTFTAIGINSVESGEALVIQCEDPNILYKMDHGSGIKKDGTIEYKVEIFVDKILNGKDLKAYIWCSKGSKNSKWKNLTIQKSNY